MGLVNGLARIGAFLGIRKNMSRRQALRTLFLGGAAAAVGTAACKGKPDPSVWIKKVDADKAKSRCESELSALKGQGNCKKKLAALRTQLQGRGNCDTTPKYLAVIGKDPVSAKPIRMGKWAKKLKTKGENGKKLDVTIVAAKNNGPKNSATKITTKPSDMDIEISFGDGIDVKNIRMADDGYLIADITLTTKLPKGKTVRDMTVTVNGTKTTYEKAIVIYRAYGSGGSGGGGGKPQCPPGVPKDQCKF